MGEKLSSFGHEPMVFTATLEFQQKWFSCNNLLRLF
jgi:hypothetical protein